MYLAVCEDDKNDLDALCSLLDAWETEHGAAVQYKAFRSAVEMLEAARKERFTLYLLDMMMPEMDGIKAAQEIRGFDDAAEIIFFSNSPGFAYESYGVRALNYLLKPAQREELFALLNRLYSQEQKNSDALTMKTTSAIVRVPFSQISYVEVIRKHVYFHLSDGTAHEVAGTLKDLEAVLLRRPEFMGHTAPMLSICFRWSGCPTRSFAPSGARPSLCLEPPIRSSRGLIWRCCSTGEGRRKNENGRYFERRQFRSGALFWRGSERILCRRVQR